jgi:nitrogen regulatory protein PII
MNAKQFRAALDKLGINQMVAGELFGVGSRTSRRWALDEARIPDSVAMLLVLLVEGELKLPIPVIEEDTGRRVEGKGRIWTLLARAGGVKTIE